MAEESWLNKMFAFLIFLQYDVLPYSLRCFTVFQHFWKIFNILGGSILVVTIHDRCDVILLFLYVL